MCNKSAAKSSMINSVSVQCEDFYSS